MSKSISFVFLLTLAAAAAMAAWIILLTPPPTAEEDHSAVTPALDAARTSLSAHLDQHQAAQRTLLAATLQSPELQAYLVPALRTKTRQPVLRPDRPPAQTSSVSVPSQESLLPDLQRLLDSSTASLGTTHILLMDTHTNTLLAHSAGLQDPQALVPLVAKAATTLNQGRGYVAHADTFLDLQWLCLADQTVCAVAQRPLDATLLQQLQGLLPPDMHLSLARKGELILHAYQDDSRRTATAQTLVALFDPANTTLTHFSQPNHPSVVHTTPIWLDDALQHAKIAWIIETSTVLPAAPAPLWTTHPFFTSPKEHLPQWLGLAAITLFLFVIGVWLLRADLHAVGQRATRAFMDAETPADVDPQRVHPALRPLMEAIGQGPATTTPRDTAAERDIERLREDIAAAEARSKQLQGQLDYARAEVSKANRALAEAKARPAAVVAPEAPLAAPAPPSASVAAAFAAQLAQPATPSATAKDFDTAEVSNEEMNQLLENIDRNEILPPLDDDEAALQSLAEMADRIGKMTESQVERLQASFAEPIPSATTRSETTVPRGELPPAPAAQTNGARLDDGWDEGLDTPLASLADAAPAQRPAAKTSELWRIPPDPNATSPGMKRTAIDEEHALPESFNQASPPWPATGEAPSLSPSSLLEALKKRTQNPAEASPEDTRVSPLAPNILNPDDHTLRQRPRTISQSGHFTRTGSRADIDPSNDTEYFKSLYEDFLATKRKCGESTDKITLERFINRLARNKQALVERYGCRTVRFQVYVKEGHAALKATPVNDPPPQS